MNKKNLIIISLILFTVFVTAYIITDQKLYFYGTNSFSFYNPLPLKVKPVFRPDFEGGFALEDNDGFFLVSRGIYLYRFSPIKLSVSKIIGYGYTRDKIIALISDSSEHKYLIEFSQNPNASKGPNIIANVFNVNSTINLNKYVWINVENSDNSKIEVLRKKLGVLCLVFFILAVFIIIRYKRY